MKDYHLLFLVSVLYLSCHAVPLLPRWIDDAFTIPVEGFTWHELTEMILSPMLLCSIFALYQHLIVECKKNPSSFRYIFPFLVITCLSQQGQGIHIAANTIHSTISPGNEYNPRAGLTQRLTYFLDENLGHHLIFFGLALSFSLLIFYDKTLQKILGNKTEQIPRIWQLIIFALSVLHGLAWFMAGVEGQTVKTISLPFSLILTVDFLLSFIRRAREGSVTRYFQMVGIVSLVLLLWWGWRYRWDWPEFRVLGLGPFSTWLGQFRNFIQKIVPARGKT